MRSQRTDGIISVVRWVISAALFFLAACGGDGGGVVIGPTVPGSYSGLTTPAAIDEANAVSIVSGAWFGAVATRDIGDVVPTPLAAESASRPFGSALPTLVKTLQSLALQIIPGALPEVSPLEIMIGSCGGTVEVIGTVDNETGFFSWEATFSDYCEFGTTLNGGMLISGKVDLALSLITRLNLTFLNLTATDGVETVSLPEGMITYVLTADLLSETDTLNLVLRNDLLQKSYWLRNYVIVITYDVPDKVTFNGRYYDPDYGYCDITTLVTIEVPDTVLPTAGVLLFTGADSQARLTFNADQSTSLDVDSDNDGIFETTIFNPI